MRAPLLAAIPLTLAAAIAQAQTLPEAMQHALEVHPEVQAGVNARMSADYAVKAAQGGYQPRVDVLAGYGREGTDSPTTRAASGDDRYNTLNKGEASVRLQQMIFDGFATQNEVARQQSTANSRAYSLLGTSESTALKVAQAYLDVLARREYVRLADENLKNHRRVLDQIQLRTSRGIGRNADLDQAEARVAQAENNLLTEQTNLNDANTTYYSVVGMAPDQLVAPAPNGIALFPASLDKARAQMVSSSSVRRSAKSDIAATKKQSTAAKPTPYLRFDAEFAKNADNNVSGEEGHYNGWSAMVRMQFNVCAGGSNSAAQESKAYRSDQAPDIRNNALRQLNEQQGLERV